MSNILVFPVTNKRTCYNCIKAGNCLLRNDHKDKIVSCGGWKKRK